MLTDYRHEPTLSIFVFIKKSALYFFFFSLGSNHIKFMTYQMVQRKEFPPLLICLHQLLQSISKSRTGIHTLKILPTL